MSPDDIFAAQMWPWPDPVIKRNRAGQVLFINAAFLALYGGRVETWTGQPVMGWPAPNPQGLPYRFETRAGAAPEETVYDWVEVVMADGNALAIARDVTVYQPPANTHPVPETEAPLQAAPASDFGAAPAAPLAAFAAQDALAQQLAQEPATPPAAELVAQAPAYEAPIAQAPAETQAVQTPAFDLQGLPKAEAAPAVETFAPVQPEVIEQEGPVVPEPAPVETPPVQIEAPVYEPAPTPATEPQTAPAPEGAVETAPTAETAAPERAYERRALPIENDEAVLGSNWRDAVIARAVGGAIATPADAAPSESDLPAPAPASAAQDKEPVRILLAEDNAINALLTRTLLEADGCIVETVEDGALAVEAAKNNQYDLILMDMRMPNMDGLEATRKIRAMGGERADTWPIIALTANAFDDDRNACFDSGMNDFMTKPVSAEELTAMVTQWIDRSRAPKKDPAMAG